MVRDSVYTFTVYSACKIAEHVYRDCGLKHCSTYFGVSRVRVRKLVIDLVPLPERGTGTVRSAAELGTRGFLNRRVQFSATIIDFSDSFVSHTTELTSGRKYNNIHAVYQFFI